MQADRETLVIMGPTAVGKTAYAINAAVEQDGEIISADSRQVYKGMDIGTGKDLNEYKKAGIRHHLIDICPAGAKYNLYNFKMDAEAALNEILQRGKKPIICGGTALYLQALIQNYNLAPVPPDMRMRKELGGMPLEKLQLRYYTMDRADTNTDISTVNRCLRAIEKAAKENYSEAENKKGLSRYNFNVMCLIKPTELLVRDINKRLETRLREGMVEEVRRLKDEGLSSDDLRYYGLEYKAIDEYLTGVYDYQELKARLAIGIKHFAKRQMTFFRKMERDGIKITWVDVSKIA